MCPTGCHHPYLLTECYASASVCPEICPILSPHRPAHCHGTDLLPGSQTAWQALTEEITHNSHSQEILGCKNAVTRHFLLI